MGARGRASWDACLMFSRFHWVTFRICDSQFHSKAVDLRPTGMGLDMSRACSYCTACPDGVAHGFLGTESASQCPSAGMPRQRAAGRLQSRTELRLYGFRAPCPFVMWHDSVHPAQLHLATHNYGEGPEELNVCFPEACLVQMAKPHSSWQTRVQHVSVLWEPHANLLVTCGGQLFPHAEFY